MWWYLIKTHYPTAKLKMAFQNGTTKLRDKEEEKINEKLSHPNVQYVPNVRLGDNMNFEDVASNWGFSAVLLATGAWKDRPLPVEGIDDYINKGLYYQNPLVYWFNHYHEPDYNGAQFDLVDDAMVIGGGLASLDVAKILMIENGPEGLSRKRAPGEHVHS